MLNKKTILIVVLVVGLAFLCGACKGKKGAQTTPEPEPSQQAEQTRPTTTESEKPPVEITRDFQEQTPEVEELSRSAAQVNQSGDLLTIYFAFDESDLTDTARASLRQNANWLKTNASWGVVIQGHCDERGTIEYNLALGQRRANAVRSYLGSLGVSEARVRTVSYGEERPNDPGHTEAAWAKNRRAETLVEER